jgi:hypothetical protein
VSRVFRVPAFRDSVLAASSAEEIHRLILAADALD